MALGLSQGPLGPRQLLPNPCPVYKQVWVQAGLLFEGPRLCLLACWCLAAEGGWPPLVRWVVAWGSCASVGHAATGQGSRVWGSMWSAPAW